MVALEDAALAGVVPAAAARAGAARVGVAHTVLKVVLAVAEQAATAVVAASAEASMAAFPHKGLPVAMGATMEALQVLEAAQLAGAGTAAAMVASPQEVDVGAVRTSEVAEATRMAAAALGGAVPPAAQAEAAQEEWAAAAAMGGVETRANGSMAALAALATMALVVAMAHIEQIALTPAAPSVAGRADMAAKAVVAGGRELRGGRR